MDWAKKRQLQYLGIIFFAVVTFLVVPFFVFIYEKPTCFDGKKNGLEVGVDCGGACKLLCTAQIAEPISRWDPRIFKVGEGTYSVLAYLENPNVAAEVSKAPYSFKIYDAKGIFITELKGTTYIPKGGNFAIFEPNINVGERIPTRATFEFTSELAWVRDTNIPPKIEVTNRPLQNQDIAPRVVASVKNTSLVRVPNIDLTTVISDGAGNAIGASRTYIEALNPGESQDVTFTWPTPFNTKVEVCALPIDVAIAIDRSGSMAAFGDNPPQPLTDVKNAGIFFVNQLDAQDQAGFISFATDATISPNAGLTSNFDAIVDAIGATSIQKNGIQQTNISDAIIRSFEELTSARHRNGVGSVIVLLTDGIANVPTNPVDKQYPEHFALAAGEMAKKFGIRIFTIGLGKDINTTFLQSLATSPDDYYSAPTTAQLTNIYSQIATKICTKKPASIEIITRQFPYPVAF